MLSKAEKSFAAIFVIIVIAELICDNVQSLNAFHYITKPLILIALLIFFWKHSRHLETKSKQFTILALVFSLLGDVFLMFVDAYSNFFIIGLVSFLLAHIFYVFVFLKKKNSANNALPFLIVLLLYAFAIFYFLKDGLGDLFIPVIVYMFVILLMGIMAYLRRGSVPENSFILVFLGALFFITSDSLLALNKFYQPLPLSSLSIITTYSIAQLCIVFGIKKQL